MCPAWSRLPVSGRHAYALVGAPPAGERCLQMLLEDYDPIGDRQAVALLGRDGRGAQ
jgi:hypothetical protein